MTEVGVQFSITDAPLQVVTKTTTGRRRKSPIITTPGNLFNHQRRSHQMQYSTVLPIISFSSLSDFKQKLIRMASSNKSTKQTTTQSPTSTEFRLKIPSPDMSQSKSRINSSLNRSVASNIPKSSRSYPTIISRPSTSYRPNQQQRQQQQPGARFLYVVNTPPPSHRTSSARISNSSFSPLPLHQQPHLLTSPLLPRPHPQYGHFLAYLRRQSLARIRRKQQEQEEGNGNTVETTITFNSSRQTPSSFHSTSNLSLGVLAPETSSMPSINLQPKRKPRPISSYRFIQRSSSSLPTNYRLNLNQTPPLKLPPAPTPSPRTSLKKSPDDQSALFTPTSVLITPTNSVVDEVTITPTKKAPYELQLSGDMLNYSYVSESGVKYQGQLLSTPV